MLKQIKKQRSANILLQGPLFVVDQQKACIKKLLCALMSFIIKKSVMKRPIKHKYGNIIDDENEWGSYVISNLLNIKHFINNSVYL